MNHSSNSSEYGGSGGGGSGGATTATTTTSSMADATASSSMNTTGLRFAKHRKGFFHRLFRTGPLPTDMDMLLHTDGMIRKALLKMNRELDEEAVQCFKNIMSYMAERKSSRDPMHHAKKMLRNMMYAPAGLRDECYVQLIKQTTGNPSAAATRRGWELLCMCVATFPPSTGVQVFLNDHIRRAMEQTEQKDVQALATMCEERIPLICSLGQRREVPSSQELECLARGALIPVTISTMDGKSHIVDIDSYTTIQEVADSLPEVVGIAAKHVFALYEDAGNEYENEERLCAPKDRIVDVLARWEHASLKKISEDSSDDGFDQDELSAEEARVRALHVDRSSIPYHRLVYRAKLVLNTNVPDLALDTEALRLVFMQTAHDVVTERFSLSEREVPTLAALQLQSTVGDHNPSVHTVQWLLPRLSSYMPKSLAERVMDTDEVNSPQDFAQRIIAKHAKLVGFTALEASMSYLEFCQSLPLYGCAYFFVEQRQFRDYPSPLILAVTRDGCLFLHPGNGADASLKSGRGGGGRRVLETYPYQEIVTWGHSDEKVILVVGNIVQQRKLILKTKEGRVITSLIRDYVAVKVRLRDAGLLEQTQAAAPLKSTASAMLTMEHQLIG